MLFALAIGIDTARNELESVDWTEAEFALNVGGPRFLLGFESLCSAFAVDVDEAS